VGEATALPLVDASVNVVTTRSVLIYVEDKEAAAREMWRVLRPGGRVSLFEPINNAPSAYGRPEPWTDRPDHIPPDLFAEGVRVWERMQASMRESGGGAAERSMLHFDERDLTRIFIEAGFERVTLTYEVTYGRGRAPEDLSPDVLESQPNPNMLSYADAARAALGERASAHLQEYVEAVRNNYGDGFGALAYLTAKRSRRRDFA
jgi:SAM-dependent methyltransferase